jgi:hypothetical protein
MTVSTAKSLFRIVLLLRVPKVCENRISAASVSGEDSAGEKALEERGTGSATAA